MGEALRVGILGVGFGEVHARAFREVPGVTLAAACSRRREKVEAFAAAHGIPRWFTSAEALIASGCVDLVVVATPNQEHHPMTIAALEAGLHVLCEKPLAMDAAQAREMVAAARDRGLVLGLHLNRRMQPAIMAMRAAFDEGRLGAVRLVRATWHRQRGIPAREGFLTRARAGGGCLIDQEFSIHGRDGAAPAGCLGGTAPTVQADLVAALREGRAPRCTGEQGLRLMQVLDALYESSRRGREVLLADAAGPGR